MNRSALIIIGIIVISVIGVGATIFNQSNASNENQIEYYYSYGVNWCSENDKVLITSAAPEFDCRYVNWGCAGDPDSIPLNRSSLNKRTFDNCSRVLPCHIWGTWNDHFECVTIEPTYEYQFIELQILNETLTS
jgi:hypothetical protein